MSYINFKYLQPSKLSVSLAAFFKRMFIEHPAGVNENYFQHFYYAVSYGIRMIAAGVICIIHAIIPGCFSFTASTMLKNLINEINERYNKPPTK